MQLRGQGKQATRQLSELRQQQPLPRSKPLIEYIQHYLRTQAPQETQVQRKPVVLGTAGKGKNKK